MTSFAASTVCERPRRVGLGFIKSAFHRRFLVCAALFLLLHLPSLARASTACSVAKYDQELEIRHVIDGDTLVLGDGRKLRLIGIDTPELGRDAKPHEPGAAEARDFLQALLRHTGPYGLVFGPEATDRHGRMLAHLFLKDGRNVQALMLRTGYATPLNIPPNVHFSDCYEKQLAIARANRHGLWALPRYQPQAAQTLGPNTSGYRIVRGELTRVGESRSAIWLNLGEYLGIRIHREDLKYFPGLESKPALGTRLEARGRVYRRKGQLRMSLRHENDLKIFP